MAEQKSEWFLSQIFVVHANAFSTLAINHPMYDSFHHILLLLPHSRPSGSKRNQVPCVTHTKTSKKLSPHTTSAHNTTTNTTTRTTNTTTRTTNTTTTNRTCPIPRIPNFLTHLSGKCHENIQQSILFLFNMVSCRDKVLSSSLIGGQNKVFTTSIFGQIEIIFWKNMMKFS